MKTRICSTCRKAKDLDDFEAYNANINKSCEECMAKIRRERGEVIYDATIPRAALLACNGREWLPRWGFKFDWNFEPYGGRVRTMLPAGWAMRTVLSRTLVWDDKKTLRLRISEDEISPVPAVQITVDIEKHVKGIAGGRSDFIIGVVYVCGQIVHKTNPLPAPVILDANGRENPEKREERLKSLDFLQMICEKYISLKYPLHADPLAYWPTVAEGQDGLQLYLFIPK